MSMRFMVGLAALGVVCAGARASEAFLVPLGRVPGLGRPPSWGALSGDGRVFYANFSGLDTYHAYVWTLAGGYQPVALPGNPGIRGAAVLGASRDGSVAGGSTFVSLSPSGIRGAVWVNGPANAPTLVPNVWTEVRAVSADGTAWGGNAYPGIYRNGVWVQFSTQYGDVHGLSENGGVAVGLIHSEPGQPPSVGTAFVWSETAGLRRLPTAGVPGLDYDEARKVTLDGSFVAGVTLRDGRTQGLWLWSDAAGYTFLDSPFLSGSGFIPYLSGDGSTYAAHFNHPVTGQRSIWLRFLNDPAGGWIRFDDHLARFGVSTEGWTGLVLNSLSEDGLTFAGWGTYNGLSQHWYARIPTPPTLALLALLFAPRRRR